MYLPGLEGQQLAGVLGLVETYIREATRLFVGGSQIMRDQQASMKIKGLRNIKQHVEK